MLTKKDGVVAVVAAMIELKTLYATDDVSVGAAMAAYEEIENLCNQLKRRDLSRKERRAVAADLRRVVFPSEVQADLIDPLLAFLEEEPPAPVANASGQPTHLRVIQGGPDAPNDARTESPLDPAFLGRVRR